MGIAQMRGHRHESSAAGQVFPAAMPPDGSTAYGLSPARRIRDRGARAGFHAGRTEEEDRPKRGARRCAPCVRRPGFPAPAGCARYKEAPAEMREAGAQARPGDHCQPCAGAAAVQVQVRPVATRRTGRTAGASMAATRRVAFEDGAEAVLHHDREGQIGPRCGEGSPARVWSGRNHPASGAGSRPPGALRQNLRAPSAFPMGLLLDLRLVNQHDRDVIAHRDTRGGTGCTSGRSGQFSARPAPCTPGTPGFPTDPC